MTESDATSVLLTDDEVIGLAFLAGSSWTRPLPTVDTSSPRELERAVGRGVRSLAVRGLLVGELVDATVAEGAVRLMGRHPSLIASPVDVELNLVTGSDRGEYFFAADGDGFFVLTTAEGVNVFSPMTPTEAHTIVAGMAAEAEGSESTNQLALLARGPGGEISGFLIGAKTDRVEGVEGGNLTVQESPNDARGSWLSVAQTLLPSEGSGEAQ